MNENRILQIQEMGKLSEKSQVDRALKTGLMEIHGGP